MKTVYSTIMMLALMVAAFGFIACGSDDEDNDGESSKGKKTLTIDGEAYFCSKESVVSQGSSLYLTIYAIGDTKDGFHNEKILTVVLAPSRVSELSVGDVFDYDVISVRNFNNYNEIVVNTYNWDATSGSITIKEITETTLTIQLNKLVMESYRGAIRTIDGTAKLTNSLADSNGNVLPFSYK